MSWFTFALTFTFVRQKRLLVCMVNVFVYVSTAHSNYIKYIWFVFVRRTYYVLYIYKHHTLQYFYSSSALEANKPITNTALNTNNCMMLRAGNHIQLMMICVYMKEISYPQLHPGKKKKMWKM